jgi:CDP-diacylglycerol--glycerol-3-phosphate 3-phosphatidyltransferase
MDRVGEGALFGALVWWFLVSGQRVSAVVALVCLVGGQVVSYVKARAEGLGFTCDVGLAERMERLVLIGIGGLLTGFGVDWGLPAAAWLLAVLTVITVVQRLIHVRGQELSPAVGERT